MSYQTLADRERLYERGILVWAGRILDYRPPDKDGGDVFYRGERSKVKIHTIAVQYALISYRLLVQLS